MSAKQAGLRGRTFTLQFSRLRQLRRQNQAIRRARSHQVAVQCLSAETLIQCLMFQFNPVRDNYSMTYKRYFTMLFSKTLQVQAADLRSSKDDLSLTG